MGALGGVLGVLKEFGGYWGALEDPQGVLGRIWGGCGVQGGTELSPRSDTAEEDDDLYDCVEAEGDDGDDIYEDLMRVEPPAATVGVTPGHPGVPWAVGCHLPRQPRPLRTWVPLSRRRWRWTGGSAASRSCGRRRRSTRRPWSPSARWGHGGHRGLGQAWGHGGCWGH